MADEDIDSPYEQLQEDQKVKKRRLHGACDTCRKRKIKCDSALRPGNICSKCESAKIQCTHEIAQQPKRNDLQQAYIQSLEERLSKLEHVLRVLRPDRDIETLLDLPLSETSLLDYMNTGESSKSLLRLKPPTPHLVATPLSEEPRSASVKQEPDVDHLEEDVHVELPEHLDKLFIEDKRFFGLSSTYMFAHYILHEKAEASSSSTAPPLDSKLLRRPLYWEMRPWELSFARSQEHVFVYPEPDLLNSLVVLYFEKSNIITPVLHEPTFFFSLNSGLHLRDPAFGMTVLLVCAIGSRFTFDSRVLSEDDASNLSAGWKYYKQVPTFRNHLFEMSTLYDLQCYALSAIYLLGSSMVHVAWPMLGLGIRFAQEKGLHRRRERQELTVEDESAKRVFWALIFMDRWMCAFLGRPCAMQDEDIDLDYPMECDDEYWESSEPERAFKQPAGKPCKVTCFIWMIKLAEMLGYTLRTLYATKKSKMLIGLIGNEWESQVVAELDSSMNKWKENLPHFLRWNSENPDTTFFGQSIALHTAFYHLQMQIHRPFLMKRSALSLTSLAMCTSAARSTAHVLEVAMSRGVTLLPASYMSAFASALVLLLSHWASQSSDSTFDSKATMVLVRKLLLTLKHGERKWHSAGRFSDLVQILSSLSDQRSNPQLKRRRELGAINPAISEDQRKYHGTVWEQPGLTGGPSQRQIGATKLDPHALINNFPMHGDQHSHVQAPFIPCRVDNTPNPPITQDPDFVSFLEGTNFQAASSRQDTQASHMFQPQLQAHGLTEGPTSSVGPNMSDGLFAMWTNAPMNFSPYEWNIFLSDAMKPNAT